MILSSPAPQLGQCCMSISNTRLSSRAQAIRCGRSGRSGLVSVWTTHSLAATAAVARSSTSGPCGTTRDRSLALGASTPWNLMRCRRGRGTSAASRCMNSSGLKTRCVVPSRHGVFSFSSTCPAALTCTRSSESAGRVM